MRKIFLLLSLFTASFLQAKEFMAGDIKLDIPEPSGMIEVTPEMGDAYKYFESLISAGKNSYYLATYVLIDDIKDKKEYLHICNISAVGIDRNISKNKFKEIKNDISFMLSSSDKRMEYINKNREQQEKSLKNNKLFDNENFQTNQYSIFTPIINNDNVFMYSLALNLDENNRANDNSELSINLVLHIKRKILKLTCNWLNENGDQKVVEENMLSWTNKIISKNEKSYYEKILDDIKDTFDSNSKFILFLLVMLSIKLFREKFGKKNR